ILHGGRQFAERQVHSVAWSNPQEAASCLERQGGHRYRRTDTRRPSRLLKVMQRFIDNNSPPPLLLRICTECVVFAPTAPNLSRSFSSASLACETGRRFVHRADSNATAPVRRLQLLAKPRRIAYDNSPE